jgi:TonB-linked SusC/RagA family outer membrane protein
MKPVLLSMARIRLGAFLAAFLLISAIGLQAQNVRGTVVDQNGQGIVGASVLITGTTIGTVTNDDGSYAISNVSPDAVLEFSCIGYTAVTQNVNERSVINVTLQESFEMLDEMVVIGYGSIKKADLTGAVSVVEPEEFKNRAVTSIADALQGAAAGTIVRTSGQLGALPSIQIRGTGNLTNLDPLYIIDGIPTDNNVGFNVNDIESIQILKDASAAAIYGSRAANGVIIITTKDGLEGRTKIDFSGQVGIQNMRKLDFINGDEWRDLRTREFQWGRDKGSTSEETPEWWKHDVDWQDEYRKIGIVQEYNLAFSGGSKDSRYRTSFGYLDNSGYYIGHNMSRFTVSVKSDFKRGRFTFGESVQMGRTNSKSHRNVNFLQVLQVNPTMPIYDDMYGKNGWGYGNRVFCYQNGHNIVANADDSNGYNKNSSLYIRGSVWGQVQLFSWLSYKLNLGVTAMNNNSHGWSNGFAYAYGETDSASSASASSSFNNTFLVENTLNFNKSFGNHNLAGVLGQSYQDASYRNMGSGSRDLVQTAGGLYLKEVSSGVTPVAGSGSSSQHRLLSYFGRINYDYEGKYLLQATVRRDGTSRFATAQRWGTFPSISLGWRISKEPFYNISWMNDLKIRANYGTLGSQNVGNYDYQSNINSYTSYILYGDGNLVSGQAITDIANADIAWEKKTTVNVGIDAAFFANKLQVSLEWYDSDSKDVLFAQPILKSVGSVSSPVVNSASINNKGVELTLNYNEQINVDWSYSIRLNVAHNKNTLKSLGYGVEYHDSGRTLSKIGYPIGLFFLAKTDGLYQTNEEAMTHGLIPNATAGDIRFVDYNGDGALTTADRQLIEDKSPWPKVDLGLNFNLSFRQWSLQINGFGQLGRWVYNGPRCMYERLSGLHQVSRDYYNNIWSESNKHNNARYPRTGWNYTYNDIDYSDRWIERGDFFKFNTISLGYTVQSAGDLKKVFQSARIYLTAQNFLCLTNFTGYDPDFTAGLFTPGVNQVPEFMQTNYVNPVTFIFGANITF